MMGEPPMPRATAFIISVIKHLNSSRSSAPFPSSSNLLNISSFSCRAGGSEPNGRSNPNPLRISSHESFPSPFSSTVANHSSTKLSNLAFSFTNSIMVKLFTTAMLILMMMMVGLSRRKRVRGYSVVFFFSPMDIL
ncbi:hypothetical protein V8G54_028855, partial [Vigna mungo]